MLRTLLPTEQELFPFAWYRTMRESRPAFYDVDGEYWQVFRYDDVVRIATAYVTFSSEGRRRVLAQEDQPAVPPSIITMDPPRHRQFRKLVSQVFTPRAVAQLAPRITSIANELLDRVIPTGAVDIIDDLARPLPVIVIAELLGIPAEDRPCFRHWADTLLAQDDESGEVEKRTAGLSDERLRHAARQTLDEMRAYFAPILLERRQRPQHDQINGLLAAEVDGERLTEDELLGFCTLLLIAGHITTTNLLGNAMVCFEEHPDALATLRLDAALVPSAVEEVLRFRPPAKMVVRLALSDTTIAAQPIKRGQMIVGWIASANRDEARFSEPERFDVRREPNPHLAFGHGIHFYIGAPLARLEGKIALQVMLERLQRLERMPDLSLEPIWSPVLAGVKHYHVTFEGS